jgi:hypothetical protein
MVLIVSGSGEQDNSNAICFARKKGVGNGYLLEY